MALLPVVWFSAEDKPRVPLPVFPYIRPVIALVPTTFKPPKVWPAAERFVALFQRFPLRPYAWARCRR